MQMMTERDTTVDDDDGCRFRIISRRTILFSTDSQRPADFATATADVIIIIIIIIYHHRNTYVNVCVSV